MRYMNEQIRRQDRQLDEERARLLLSEGEYGVLSLQSENGGGYGIPINYAWDGGNVVYLHCAPEGRKLRCIVASDKVSLCVVGCTRVISDKFTTEYESIVLDCRAYLGLSPEERMEALHLLLAKYSPDDLEVGKLYAEKSFHRTEVIRLDIERWSGKCKRMR